jgi:hypothetical protein
MAIDAPRLISRTSRVRGSTTGSLEVQARAETTRRTHGEATRYAVDIAHAIRNPGRTNASAVLTVMHSPRGNP